MKILYYIFFVISILFGLFFIYYTLRNGINLLFGLIPAIFFIINSVIFFKAAKRVSRKAKFGANIIIVGIVLHIIFVAIGSAVELGDGYATMGIGAFLFIGIHLVAYITMFFVKRDKLMNKAMHDVNKVDTPLPY